MPASPDDTIEPVTGLSVPECIGAIIRELRPVGKNQRNKDQNYNFRGVDDVLKALHPLFAKYGVFFAPHIIEREYEQRTSARGNTGHCAHLHVEYRVYGPQGDFVTISTWGEGLDYSDKATNKAMTAAFKYAMFELFAICDPSEDSDQTTEPGGTTTRREQQNQPPHDESPAVAADYSELQLEIRNHPKVKEMSGPELTAFVTDVIGYENPGLKNLTDEDCEKILARWDKGAS